MQNFMWENRHCKMAILIWVWLLIGPVKLISFLMPICDLLIRGTIYIMINGLHHCWSYISVLNGLQRSTPSAYIKPFLKYRLHKILVRAELILFLSSVLSWISFISAAVSIFMYKRKCHSSFKQKDMSLHR